jgi:hypothetical protein
MRHSLDLHYNAKPINHLIWKDHSKKLENTFLQFNIVLILSKSFKNKTGTTLIFFISDVIGQYIIKEKL